MVILLNGSINSGKTTIGKYIASLGMGIAHIEVDSLRDFIRWMPLKDSIEINLENAASVAINFHKRDIDSVITTPLSGDDYTFLGSLLQSAGIRYKAIALNPGIPELKKNRGARKLTEWEFNRIDELAVEGSVNPCFGEIVNNSELSVDATAQMVLQLAGLNKTL